MSTPLNASSALPSRVAQSLKKLGADVDVARKKRRLTVETVCQRAGISPKLYGRLVRGVPGTSIGAYAMVLFALGEGTPLDDLLDVSRDNTGLMLDESRLPQRVRAPGARSGAL
jgi:transcriptional regulator with XRE-family HTH domain